MHRKLEIEARKVFAATESLDSTVREDLSNKIAIIDARGYVVATNEDWKSWASDAGDKNFPFARHGSNYLDLCRNSGQAGIIEGAKAFDTLTELLGGRETQVAIEYPLKEGGTQRQYLMTASALTAPEFSGAMICHREITLENRTAEILRSDGRILSLASVSRSFLPSLVRGVALAVGAKHALLCEVVSSDPGRLRTVSHWAGDDFGPSQEFLTEGTPCGRILESGSSCFSSGAQALFPDNPWLRHLDVQSYAGVPIHDSAGGLLGVLSVCDSATLQPDMSFEATLRLAALRAAPELERRRAEEVGSLQVLQTAMPTTSQNAAKIERKSLPVSRRPYDLTPFELDVLQLIAGGFPDGEIALRLGVTHDVVKWHVGPILVKMGCASRTAAAVKAIKSGLVDRT